MNIVIFDIETMKELFLVGIYCPHENTYHEFEVSKSKYELEKFAEFCERYKDHYWVGYNNLRFDSQVVEWVLRNYEEWGEKSNLEVAAMIAQKAQDVIDDANYELFPQYREEDLSLKQIDLFKLMHYDNKNRRVSLKRLQFEMDLENIEEMPIHHMKENMSLNDRKLTREYCKNDVMSTYEFYKIVIGETNHPLYKGNNQIQLRLDIEKEFGIPCLNYSDSKIGDEIIKKYYCEEKRIELKDLPRKGFFRKSIKVKNCIANYVTFQTVQLDQFLKKLKSLELGMDDDLKEHIHFYDNTYSFMKGGLHTENKPEIFEADETNLIIDVDVASFYPAIIINNKQYPFHLGKEFLIGYRKMFERRLELKPLAKKDKKIKGIVGALKLAVNGTYGKTSDMLSWMYDRQVTMFTTISGELSLMMLIEAYELKDIRVISCNTDGVTVMIYKDKVGEFEKINNWWMNLTKYELERVDYKKIIFSTVNDYIAITTNGEIKKKGDFLTDFELHKNKSARIVPIALERYFVDGIDVMETIIHHRNPYDFCIRQKSTKDFHYEGYKKIKLSTQDLIITDEEIAENGWEPYYGESYIRTEWITSGKPYDRMATSKETVIKLIRSSKSVNKIEKSVYNKLIRYYVTSGDDGEKLMKIKNEDSDSTAPEAAQVEAGEWLCKVVNYLPAFVDVDDMKINYEYYIEKAENMIVKIITNGKRKKQIPKIPNQMSLF